MKLQNDFFSLKEDGSNITIQVFKKGYNILQFNSLINENPRIRITEFLLLKNALETGESNEIKVGFLKPEIECFLEANNMEAKAILNITNEQFSKNRFDFFDKIKTTLLDLNVKEKFICEEYIKDIKPSTLTLVAKGKPAIHGSDAKTTYLEKSDRKPTIKEDGKADFFDMNFFIEVKKGDWLGEKEFLTLGENGMTLIGEVIPAKPGRDQPFLFDVLSVQETIHENKIVLVARKNGVAEFNEGKLSVGDYLYIKEDVGVETGNIDFQGSVTIKGTIQPGFSVRATKDISILGALGVSKCKSVISLTGDIYIKGGIFGNNKTLVEAGRDIYLKHANECSLKAQETIYIGYNAISCNLYAKHVKTDLHKGSIIGGKVKAKASVMTGTIGNKAEKRTEVTIEGIDKEAIQHEIKQLLMLYKNLLQEKDQLQKKTSLLHEKYHKLSIEEKKRYDEISSRLSHVIKDISELDKNRKSLAEFIHVKGEGQITAAKKIHSNTSFDFSGRKKMINSETKGTYYYQDNKIKYELDVEK